MRRFCKLAGRTRAGRLCLIWDRNRSSRRWVEFVEAYVVWYRPRSTHSSASSTLHSTLYCFLTHPPRCSSDLARQGDSNRISSYIVFHRCRRSQRRSLAGNTNRSRTTPNRSPPSLPQTVGFPSLTAITTATNSWRTRRCESKFVGWDGG